MSLGHWGHAAEGIWGPCLTFLSLPHWSCHGFADHTLAMRFCPQPRPKLEPVEAELSQVFLSSLGWGLCFIMGCSWLT